MIILNELNYAEQCIKDGIIDDKPFFTLSILAKYYYHHLGYKKRKIIDELTEFLSLNYPRYQDSKADWDATIETIAANCQKYPLYEIEGIWITKAEMDSIKAIHNKVLERLAFTMLCLAKLAIRKNDNANGWINEDAKTIFSLARISGSVLDRNIRIGQLAEIGILELPKKNDLMSVRVTIVNDNSENLLFIHDFRELGYEYLKYCGQNIIRCAECGILVRGNKAGTKRYCSDCAAYIPQGTKKITCIDCGKIVAIDSKNNKTCRCEECQLIANKENARLRKQKQRSKEKCHDSNLETTNF